VAFLYDSRQREYPILITRHAFEIGGPQTIVCGCETPARNQATRYTAVTKAYVENRKQLKQQKDAYDEALRELAEDIEKNAHGLYAEEIDDPDDPNIIPSRNQLFLVANWLLSDRLVVAEPAFETFASASIYHQLFGLGYTFGTPRGTTFQALIEMDFFALLLNQGIVGLLLYIIPLALFAWFCLKNLFKPSANVEEQEDKVAYTLSVLLLIGCACLAGHVFTAPAVSIYLAISMVKLYGLLAK
jgi:hypothetical protein